MQRQQNRITVWAMWFLASFFYAYQYILRVLPNIMMEDILEKFHIDAAAFGQFSGLYYIGYAGMHIPVGILLDRYGPKWVLPLCMLLTVTGLLPLLYAQNWIYPGLGRLLIGMGSSAAILGVFKIIRMSFSQEKFPVILGCSVTLGVLGAIYGGQPVNYLLQTFGWHNVLHIIILIGCLLAAATFWIIPSQSVAKSPESILASLKHVFTHPKIMLICLLAGIMVGPLEGFADVWGTAYLKTVYQLSPTLAASFPSLIFLGMCVGSPLLSWIATKTHSYLQIIMLSGLIMGISFILLLTKQVPMNLLGPLFVIIGIFCAYQILAIFKASTYVGENLVGLTTASANMIIMTFGYIFHSIIGQLMAHSWNGQMQAGIPLYDATAYTQALSVIPFGLLLGSIGYGWLAIQATKYKRGIRAPL